MNENTTQLIEQLAQKLGTTAEYLWSVLLKQAPISAITDLALFCLSLIVGFVLYRLHKYFTRTEEYDNNEFTTILMIGLFVFWGVFLLICVFSFQNIITGLYNPEYWALKEVLKSINP